MRPDLEVLMYQCEGRCQKQIGPGVSQRTFVAEDRPKVYYDQRGEVQGEGREIVREVKMCPSCFDEIVSGAFV